MPKICCIIDCHDKSNNDCQQRTLFAVPKDEERRQKWHDVIFPYLRDGRKSRKLLYVCDRHFKDDDILRSTSILLKDGSTDMISCLQVKLKSSSIPCIFNENHKVLPTIDLPAVEIKRSSSLSSLCEEETKLILEENMETEITYPEEEKKPDLISDEKGETTYDLKMLEKELNNLWEKKNNRVWASFKISSGLMISFFGENPKIATKTILVQEDMDTEIRADGKIVMTNFKDKIKSLDDVVSLMKEVRQNHLCPGSDSSAPCPYNNFGSSMIPNGRCISCRIARKQRLDNLRRVSKRSDLKKIKDKQLIKNLKRKNERLVKNLAAAKESIEELKAQCATASEDAIEKAMKDFSPTQQEAVRACLAAAQCKGSTGVRYSQRWIFECIRLLNKSRQAYLHVLSHRILPVPTIDTLKKYMKKMESSDGFNVETINLFRAEAVEMICEETC